MSCYDVWACRKEIFQFLLNNKSAPIEPKIEEFPLPTEQMYGVQALTLAFV